MYRRWTFLGRIIKWWKIKELKPSTKKICAGRAFRNSNGAIEVGKRFRKNGAVFFRKRLLKNK